MAYAGSQTVLNNSYVNAEFIRFSANDSNTGIAACYVMPPWQSTFESGINGTEFTQEGKYIFYATDIAGNASIEFAVTLDRTKPSAQLNAGGNIVQNGSYTNASFISFVTEDINLKAAYVKLLGATSFSPYSPGSMYFKKGNIYFIR